MTSLLGKRLGVLAVAGLTLVACKGSTPAANGTSPAASASPTATRTAEQTGAPTGSAVPTTGTGTGSSARPTIKPAVAPPTVPPAAGTYTYTQSGETKVGSFSLPIDPTGTLEIDPAVKGGGGMRQRQIRTYSDKEQNEQRYLFTNRGVYVESTKASIYGQSQECETEDPLIAVELPLEVGARWSDSGDCDGLHISLTGRILRTEMFTVGGTRVKTYVIKVVAKATGDASQDTTETMWLSPDYRLVVHSVSDSEGSAQGFDFTAHRTETLRSLTPK